MRGAVANVLGAIGLGGGRADPRFVKPSPAKPAAASLGIGVGPGSLVLDGTL